MNGPHWIKQWIADLAALNDQFRDDEGKIDFDALGREEYAFRTALITHRFKKSTRAKDSFNKAKLAYDASVENGKKGGRPRKEESRKEDNSSNGKKSAQEARHIASDQSSLRIPAPRDKHEVMDFAEDNGLDVEDARLWYQRNYVERPGCDKDGEVIRNWRGALINACKAEEERRFKA